MKRIIDVAIVGAAFSGSLLAIQILRRRADVRVFLIEKAPQFGRGLAYGAADPEHLLNVRASNMSAFPDEPDHFIDWLRANAPQDVEPRSFVSRRLFGTYLQAMLRDIVETAQGAGRLVTVPDEAVAVTFEGRDPRVHLAVGRVLEADHVVLASGNLPPRDLPCFANADPTVYVSDPWADGAFASLKPNDRVLLVGTGLTAVDMILRLGTSGHTGSIHALSRRGLRPRRHQDHGPQMVAYPVPATPSLTMVLRLLRSRSRTGHWREAVDGLRPSVQRLWREASDVERRRFLRHLRPWWDVHRHRLAPRIAEAVETLETDGRLTFSAGRIETIRFRSGTADVTWRPRGKGQSAAMVVDRIVNCTGPAGDLTRATSPLYRDLFRNGLVRPDACGLGLDVDADCRIVDAHGTVHERLRAIGPVSRGAFWEITAVPDIRVQAARVASLLSPD